MMDTKHERKNDSKQNNNDDKHKWENIPTKIQNCQILNKDKNKDNIQQKFYRYIWSIKKLQKT